MPTVRLILRSAELARVLADRLTDAGWAADVGPSDAIDALRIVQADPLDVTVVGIERSFDDAAYEIMRAARVHSTTKVVALGLPHRLREDAAIIRELADGTITTGASMKDVIAAVESAYKNTHGAHHSTSAHAATDHRRRE